MPKKWIAALLSIAMLYPVSVLANDDLVLGGNSVGIVVTYEGVLISGTYRVEMNNVNFDPQDMDIHKGDMIIKVNDQSVTSLDDLYAILKTYQEEVNEIPITIMRNEQELSKTLKTVYDKNSGAFQCGLYVKDEIVGVGTMTYYDPSTQTYGALGHEISDVDLKQRADIESGTIYDADVNSITKAHKGVAGEKHAVIDYQNPQGNIKNNTEIGIYGNYEDLPENVKKLPWVNQDLVHTGKAQIYTVLSGSQIETYSINITKVNKQSNSDVKGIEFVVDDEALLMKTNGIIQGMSGSPIVQDGAIIGAVTHVITSDPASGYGVFIEWMLKESQRVK